MAKMSKDELNTLKATPEGRLRKNIDTWKAHCAKIEARGKATKGGLSQDEKDDLTLRGAQIRTWEKELKEKYGA